LSVAVVLAPLTEAVTVDDTLLETGTVVAVKVADEEPAGIFNVAKTVTAELLLLSDTDNPPEGAGDERVSVPRELFPPATVLGLNERPERVGAVMVRGAEYEAEPRLALMLAV
jgi:hypothetical protein